MIVPEATRSQHGSSAWSAAAEAREAADLQLGLGLRRDHGAGLLPQVSRNNEAQCLFIIV